MDNTTAVGSREEAPIRVLVIAEAANPEWVSVPLVGWSHSRALADITVATLVTQIRNRNAILRTGLREGRDLTVIDSERVAARLHWMAERLRGGRGRGWTVVTALSSLAYYYFEYLVWQQFRDSLRTGQFDLVHRLTPLSPTTPSLLAKRCRDIGIPFILGPLNGGLPWPAVFDDKRRRENEWLSYVRSAHALMPGYHTTRRDASAIIVGSRDTLRQIPPRYRDKCVYIPENGIDPRLFSDQRGAHPELPLRVAFAGRLVPYKGCDILLEAAAPLLKAERLTLDIIGDGPEMGNMRRLAGELNVAHRVTFAGWVSHQQMQQRMVEADVFAFPSIREFGGGVVLEAMALGLVPIVVDYGGPGELVTDDTGYRLPLGTHAELVDRLRDVLRHTIGDPQSIRLKGDRARERVMHHFTWDAKALQVKEVYRWVLGRRPDKPDFGAMLAEPPVLIGSG